MGRNKNEKYFKFFLKKFWRLKFLLYLCTRNPIERLAALKHICGNSSVGRAQPCQGWGREFESRFPLTKRRRQLTAVFFLFDTMTRTKRPQYSPSRGRGCKYNSRKCLRAAWARVSFSAPSPKVLRTESSKTL